MSVSLFFPKSGLIGREEDVAYFSQKLAQVNYLVLPELFYQVSVLLFRKECFVMPITAHHLGIRGGLCGKTGSV